MSQLAQRYEELVMVERDLRQAQSNLLAAHHNFANHDGPRPEIIFRQVLRLRQQSRALLSRLGEDFVAGP